MEDEKCKRPAFGRLWGWVVEGLRNGGEEKWRCENFKRLGGVKMWAKAGSCIDQTFTRSIKV